MRLSSWMWWMTPALTARLGESCVERAGDAPGCAQPPTTLTAAMAAPATEPRDPRRQPPLPRRRGRTTTTPSGASTSARSAPRRCSASSPKLLGPQPGPYARSLEIGAGTGYFSLNLLQAGRRRARRPAPTSRPGMLADARGQRAAARARRRDRRRATPPSCRSRTRRSTSCWATPSCTTSPSPARRVRRVRARAAPRRHAVLRRRAVPLRRPPGDRAQACRLSLAAPLWRSADASAPCGHGYGSPNGGTPSRGTTPMLSSCWSTSTRSSPPTCERLMPGAGLRPTRASRARSCWRTGSAGSTARSRRARDHDDIPWLWFQYAFRGYLALQQRRPRAARAAPAAAGLLQPDDRGAQAVTHRRRRARADTPGAETVAHLNNAGAASPPGPCSTPDRAVAARGLPAATSRRPSARTAPAHLRRGAGSSAPPRRSPWSRTPRAPGTRRSTRCRFAPGDRMLTARAEYASDSSPLCRSPRAPAPASRWSRRRARPGRRRGARRRCSTSVSGWCRVPRADHGGLVNPAAAIGAVTRAAGVPLPARCLPVGRPDAGRRRRDRLRHALRHRPQVPARTARHRVPVRAPR